MELWAVQGENAHLFSIINALTTEPAMTQHALVTYLDATYCNVKCACADPCGPTFCGGSPCCSPSARCRGVKHKAECSCPVGMEGDARLGGQCYPSRSGVNGHRTSGSGKGEVGIGVGTGGICSQNPCGQIAVCNVGSDRSGKTRPVCTCP